MSDKKIRETVVLNREEGPARFQAQATVREDQFASVKVGEAIDGFKIIDALAEGGMGAVYRVKARDGQGELALKAPLPDGRGGTFAHRMRRFLREVRLASRMDHPGVAKVVEVGQNDGLPYFTMELVDGEPLSERFWQGPMPVREALRIIESAARGVHHIHEKGVIHRDLKPQNILLRKNGDVVIIDFGLARDAQGIDPRITQSGVWLGTPAYIAPEQAQGLASSVDARADVYSLGAVLYEALTGQAPYGSGQAKQIFKNLKHTKARTVRELRPDVTEAVEKAVMKAIAKNREERFATALELAAALQACRAELPVDASVADLDAIEDATSREDAPILRAKKPVTEKKNKELAERTANIDLAPKKRGVDTERRLRAAGDGKAPSARWSKQRISGEDIRAKLLVLGGPAILAACGLLLLFI